MTLPTLLNIAYAALVEGRDPEARVAFDRQLAGLSAPPSRRAREGQAQLMGAMELGR